MTVQGTKDPWEIFRPHLKENAATSERRPLLQRTINGLKAVTVADVVVSSNGAGNQTLLYRSLLGCKSRNDHKEILNGIKDHVFCRTHPSSHFWYVHVRARDDHPYNSCPVSLV